MYCSKCGSPVGEADAFCAKCATNLSENKPVAEQPVQAAPQPQAVPFQQQPMAQPQVIVRKFDMPGGMLAWSIIMTVLNCASIIGLALGIIAIVFTVSARDQFTKEEFDKKVKNAKILNIINTILFVLGLIITIIMIVMLAAYAAQNDSSYYYTYASSVACAL